MLLQDIDNVLISLNVIAIKEKKKKSSLTCKNVQLYSKGKTFVYKVYLLKCQISQLLIRKEKITHSNKL